MSIRPLTEVGLWQMLEPLRKGQLLALLSTKELMDESLPDVDGDLAPMDDVEL